MMKGVLIAIMILELLAVDPSAAITCQDVISSLSPCLQYLTGGGSPSSACCGGVSGLKSLSTVDKRAACECLKATYSQHPGIRADLAASLPKACGVDLGMPITKDVKCSDIS